MKCFFALVLCFVIPVTVFAEDSGYKVIYDGGSVPGAKAGSDMKLYIDGNQVRITKGKADVMVIPASAITEISYGQDVHRRVGAAIGLAFVSLGIGALMVLSKSKKHLLVLHGTPARAKVESPCNVTRVTIEEFSPD